MNHQAQLEDFIAAIKEKRDALVTGEEGTKALAIVLAIYASSRQGKTMVMDSRS